MPTPATVYNRHEPEGTVLYDTIRTHYLSFLAELDAADRTLPMFIEREFHKFLSCGILAHGFVRLQCDACVGAFNAALLGWLRRTA